MSTALAPCVFVRSVELPAAVETVFDFHANPRNIPLISPPWQRITIDSPETAPRPGAEFTIRVRFFGLFSMVWQGVWRETTRPTLLVDEALHSPFAFWRHQHEFQSLDAHRTLMTDRVFFLFPGGRLGRRIGNTLGQLQFAWMFADRHARTRRWMRENV